MVSLDRVNCVDFYNCKMWNTVWGNFYLMPIVVFSGLIVQPEFRNENYVIDCHLPSDLLPSQGTMLLEDCDSLDRFVIPVPSGEIGVHPKVCCPQFRGKFQWLYPSDPCHPDYEDLYDYDGCNKSKDDLNYGDSEDTDTMSDKTCIDDSTSCVSIDQCLEYLDDPHAPQTDCV